MIKPAKNLTKQALIYAFKMKKAQVWVETVIYTVIGLAIIGILLAVATPSINRYRDKTIIEQTIDTLNNMNNKILETRDAGLGNRRMIEFQLKKGNLNFNSPKNKIVFNFESNFQYSELGEDIPYGDIIIRTEEFGRNYNITLTLPYDGIDLKSNEQEEEEKFSQASVPYRIFAENRGISGEKIIIDIQTN